MGEGGLGEEGPQPMARETLLLAWLASSLFILADARVYFQEEHLCIRDPSGGIAASRGKIARSVCGILRAALGVENGRCLFRKSWDGYFTRVSVINDSARRRQSELRVTRRFRWSSRCLFYDEWGRVLCVIYF